MNRLNVAAISSGASVAAVVTMIASLALFQRRWLSAQTTAYRHPQSIASKLRVVMVSVPSAEVGKVIARALVEEKLAACVQVVGSIESVYSWEGQVQTDPENLLFIKTKSALVPDLTQRVLSLHPYDTPEVISIPIEGGSDKYLNWVMTTTS